MSSGMLFEPSWFEPLSDEPWREDRVRDAIGAIVADAKEAFDPKTLWPAHEWDAGDTPLPLKSLYVGASGVIWALDALRRRGHDAGALDLEAAVLRALEMCRADPDIEPGETHYHPASLFFGESGPLLVAFKLTADAAHGRELEELLPTSAENATDDLMWGLPGALLALLALHTWTGEPRWAEAGAQLASLLVARRGDDGLWRQDDDYRGLGTLHGAAGNTLVLLRRERDEALARATAALLADQAVRNDGQANWPGAPDREPSRLQWCTGAPGVIAGASGYLAEELLLAGAELIWSAGAPRDVKGHGLCHGTSGNGFALLKAFARTGDEQWLSRARRFAVHALGQAERIAKANGRRRYSLFTGDVGTALFAAACLEADASFPIIDLF
jgi:lantibiotic modifying enzyme